MTPGEDWSPWKKWWMDVVKFAATFMLSALVSVTVLDKLQDARAVRQFERLKSYESDLKVLEEFRRASLVYQEATYEAWMDALRGHNREDSEVIRHWQGIVNDDFLLSLELLEGRFAGKAALRDLPSQIEELRRIYDAMFDSYISHIRRIGKWERPPLELLTEFQRARQKIIATIDSHLAQP